VGASGCVHPVDREAILELSRKGVATTIITGRLFSGTRDIAIEIGALGAIGCVDGCHLVDVGSGRDHQRGGLSGPSALRLREIIARLGPMSFVFTRDEILYEERGAAHLAYVRTWSRDLVATTTVTEHGSWSDPRGIMALVSLDTEQLIGRVRAEIERSLPDSAFVTVFPFRRGLAETTWGMIVRASGYSKGTALTWLARHYGTTLDEVIAVGDWFNDVPMFEVAGRSFAMAHAPEMVKQAATDRLTADVQTGGGIAEAAVRAGLL